MSLFSEEQLAIQFEKLGFQDKKVKEILKNKKVSIALGEIIAELPSTENANTALLHSFASLAKDATEEVKPYRKLVTEAIADSRLKTSLQLDAAWTYVKENKEASTSVGLDKAAGVGIEVTEAQINEEVAKYISENKTEIETQRYKIVPSLLTSVKKLPSLKWANPGAFKPIIDKQILELLGPKDERDLVKKKEKKEKPTDKKAEKEEPVRTRSMFSEGFLGALHKPGGNAQVNQKFMDKHLKFTGGRVFTRFPPEPNGYLHIGHSKAIAVNFGYAKFHDGVCYLRYDDTNPEAEEEQYFTSIRETVDWLGFKPYKITYSSDYFDQLYELAEFLIQKGLAYVCFCTAEEMKAGRGLINGKGGHERKGCADREKSVEVNLQQFRDMRDGKYGKGEATLRMKQDFKNDNPQMWDLVAYRVLNAPHHRTGDKWKIYPTYDFTHCLVDSFENISHSLCTTEFYLSRESYEWLCDAVEVYKPAQREYGRLNLTGTIMSKRKIAKLVNDKYVRGWDDPRLFTLVGIRRRGVPPGAILHFVAQLGVTTSNSNIQTARFESSVRKYLEDSTPRLMMVLDPIPVILENLPENHYEEFDVPFKPGSPEMGSHKLPFTRKFYIDRSDFREEASKDYFRMAPGQSVGLLKVPHNVRVTSFTKDESGNVTEIRAHYENDVPAKKPKTFIQWIADAPAKNSPVRLGEVRLFNQLFKSENPESNPDGFLADINPDSESILKNAIIEAGFFEVKENSPWTPANAQSQSKEEQVLQGKETKGEPEAVRFQALRVGYFCMDKDSTDNSIVLNRIVTLKEDSAKSK